MKDKRYKYAEDVIEDYLELSDEQIEIPLLIAKAKDKQAAFLDDHNGNTLKPNDTEDGFKIFMQLKKYEDRKTELENEIAEVEGLLKDFLQSLNGSKVSYEKKDDNKTKITYLFWLEDGSLKSNR